MTIKEKINVEKSAKEQTKVAISGTGLNTNYDVQSKEYKICRAKINQLQKDLRSVFSNFAGNFKFDTSKGYFVATKEGQTFFVNLSSEEQNELIGMFSEIETYFADNVAKTEIKVKRNYVK